MSAGAPAAGSGSHYLSPPEQSMRDAIEWLLTVPPEERARMERAVNYTYTRDKPAPSLQPSARGRSSGNVLLTLNTGCVEAGLALLQADGTLRPALLNFAHSYNCGGGFEHSGGSQEEDIFSKTSLFLSLWPHRRADDGPGVLARGMWIGDFDEALPRKEPCYPHTACGGIYTPHARVIRRLEERRRGDGELQPAADVERLPTLGVLTVAAQDLNRERFDAWLLDQKLRTALSMAVEHGHDAVVLGAFGCGYFRNPPDVVAAAFGGLLRGEFEGCFRVCVFAIPGRGGSGSNLDAFVERFPLVGERELRDNLSASAVGDTAAGAQAQGDAVQQRSGGRRWGRPPQ
eukprot:TRINITY_DN7574_c0_g1_i1.p1 TRINITY_DN7574_c0_g1~~TRINITY_DN7574_c0_g1_i1.p1  ORF type:complete len:371 (+),score=55.85 TRINITY_DN7574_c0_g1_i1:80-1114(+)